MAKSSVDLLTSIPQPKSTWEKIFDWTFSIGRYLVVFVEAIVILAFVARFAMDRLKNDLDKQIAQNVSLLEFYRDEGKTDQVLLNYYSMLGSKIVLDNQPRYSAVMLDINTLIGQLSTVRSINIDGAGVTITGEAENLTAVQKVESALKTSDFLTNVEFDLNAQSLRDGSETVEFLATGTLSQEKYFKNYVTDKSDTEETSQ